MSDKNDSKHFLLVGNGPYTNRGCEAIVRGTMSILRHEFRDKFRVTLGTFETPEVVAKQAVAETDPLITHVSLRSKTTHRWSLPWWRHQVVTRLLPGACAKTYSMLEPFCKEACCALQIGGDNYTLDYGRPLGHIALDNYLCRHKVPIALWGASVGPFESDPEFATTMFEHLRTMRAIFVRESDSYKYLAQGNLRRHLYQVSDPAFVMEPIEPPAEKIGCRLPADAIGLNLSPLMARYVTGGDMDAWVKMGADIVESIIDATHRDILLIPHVTWAETDDHAYLRLVTAICHARNIQQISCLNNMLTAAETKWVISRCAVFAGARTHSTIAAISSCVPTLSLAYSRKARGLNLDIFGHLDYCLQPTGITPRRVAESLIKLLSQGDSIRAYLEQTMPSFRQKAFHSGTLLRQLLETP